jgi:D12 class N6 adenine-specific DNA methyltransferase
MTERKNGSKPESEGQPTVPRLTPPLKWHGGKYYLTKPILDLMPKAYRHYVELFGGGLALLWALNPVGVSEVVNDDNGNLMNFYSVLQSEKLFAKFLRRVQAIPFSRVGWEEARRNLAEQPNASRASVWPRISRTICWCSALRSVRLSDLRIATGRVNTGGDCSRTIARTSKTN